MAVLGIIPARKGSKRLPNKNTTNLGGVPLIQYSIDYAITNKDILSEVVVSTNCPVVKQIAKKSHLKIIDRPEHISEDTTPTIAVMQHALNVLEQDFDAVILLQPTNPLRPSCLLKEAIDIFRKQQLNSLFTVSPSVRKYGTVKAGRFVPVNYNYGQRSQDMKPLYFENGLLYITKSEVIKKGIIFDENSYPMIVNHRFAEVDIDTYEDMKYAEYVLKTVKQ